jgi:hypothetical protein
VSTYRYSETTIQSIVARFRRQRLWFVGVGSLCLALGILAAYRLASHPTGHSRRDLWGIAVAAFLVEHLLRTIWNWRTSPAKFEESFRATTVTVSPERVSISRPKLCLHLDRREITQAEIDSRRSRIVLRSADRYRRLIIPAGLDNFGELRREIETLGVPVGRESRKGWADLLPAFLFSGVLLCSVLSKNPLVLRINTAVALVVSLGFFYILNAQSDVARSLGWKRWAAFLPLLFAAAGLWLAH